MKVVQHQMNLTIWYGVDKTKEAKSEKNWTGH